MNEREWDDHLGEDHLASDGDEGPAPIPFERWVEIAPVVGPLKGEGRARELSARGMDISVWNANDLHWVRELASDLEAGLTDRIALYAERCVGAMAARRAAAAAAPAKATPVAPRVAQHAAPPPVRAGQDETVEGVGILVGDGLPFGGAPSPEFRAELGRKLPHPSTPREGRDETVMLLDEAVVPTALPFDPRGVDVSSQWSIERYAAFCGDLVVDPSRAAEVLAEYDLADPSTRQSLDRSFRARMRSDDALKARFEALFRERRMRAKTDEPPGGGGRRSCRAPTLSPISSG